MVSDKIQGKHLIMPRQIALFAAYIFIFFLIKFDSKITKGISNALWFPLIWFMIVSSKMISQWMNPGSTPISATDLSEGSPIDRSFFFLLIFFAIIILHQRRTNIERIINLNNVVLILFIYSLFSILWSDFPIVAFKRWFKSTGNLLMVLVILSDPKPVEALKAILRRCSYFLLPLSIIYIKYFPEIGREYHRVSGELMALGVTTHKNSLGSLTMLCGVYFFWELIQIIKNKTFILDKYKAFISILFLGMVIWLLQMADSSTSLACFLLGIVFLLCTSFPVFKKNTRLVGVFVLTSLFLFTIIQILLDIRMMLLNSMGKDATLTDRTLLWEDCLKVSGNPVIGTGYESFWLGSRLEKLWDGWWWQPTEAHNGYLETYLNIGWIGIILLIIVILVTYKNIKNQLNYDFDLHIFRLTLLVITIVYNISESAFFGMQLWWFIFLLICIDIPHYQQKNAT